MSHYFNQLGQPIGFPVPDWVAPPSPKKQRLQGSWCVLDPLTPSHTEALHAANSEDRENKIWTYMPYGPFSSLAEYRQWVEAAAASFDPQFYVILQLPSRQAVGVASYLRIDPVNGCIEVGHICYSLRLQRTPAATEAMYLMMKNAFDLGYRRYEWKCDALNEASRRAAGRLGFRFEGVFHQATIYKGRNRDTAWYSVTDSEWAELEPSFVAWLDKSNFDGQGRQLRRLKIQSERATDPLYVQN